MPKAFEKNINIGRMIIEKQMLKIILSK